MLRILNLAVIALVGLVSSASAHAESRTPIHPWQHLDDGLAATFSPQSWIFYGAAAASTPPLVWYADRAVQDYFQQHDPLGDATGQAALYAGGSLPAVLPLSLYLGGLATSDAELATAGAAALQAGLFQLAWVSTLKWITDRAGPFPDGDSGARRWHSGVLRDSDDPRDFDWNPLRLRWGLRWPSGHTASSFAMVSALVAFYPDQPWIAWVGYPLAALIGIGMIEGDYHWLSDVTAGALIGYPIGWQIGRTFRRRFDDAGEASRSTSGVTWTLGTSGVQLRGYFP